MGSAYQFHLVAPGVEVDKSGRILRVEGVIIGRETFDYLRHLAHKGQLFRFLSRDSDGMITLQNVTEPHVSFEKEAVAGGGR